MKGLEIDVKLLVENGIERIYGIQKVNEIKGDVIYISLINGSLLKFLLKETSPYHKKEICTIYVKRS